MWCTLLADNIESCFSVYTEEIVQPHVYEPEGKQEVYMKIL